MANDASILREGETCAKIAPVADGAFIYEGQAYFRAFRRALRQAEHRVTLLAWDLHSEVRLERDEEDGYPRQLGAFLNAILEEKPNLEIYILVWDFSMIYAAEREWRAFSKWLREPHPRLHFRRDAAIAVGGSHHQKVVVVDESFAFLGGIDLSTWRWDEPAHHHHDERRKDPKGEAYGPYHDIQMAVTGPIVEELAALFAERWERATEQAYPAFQTPASEPLWPEGLQKDFKEVDIGIARTFAPYDPHPAVYEIEALHLKIIETAENYLYLENQYLSSRRLVEALGKRLEEPEGPEVILILTQDTQGWIEEKTMGLLRDRLLELLSEHDVHKRLRVRYPEVRADGAEPVQVYVHAKVIIADDRLIKIGSSNLSNRSMRIDSEVDLVIAQEETFAPAVTCLQRLLAIHLHLDEETVKEARAEQPNLRSLIDHLEGRAGHALVPVKFGCENDLQRRLADTELLDPDEPMDPQFWIRNTADSGNRKCIMKRILTVSAIIAAGIFLAFSFSWGWEKLVDRESAMAYLEGIRGSPWAPLVLGLIFLVASLVGASLNVLLIAAALVLNPWIAFATGLGGSLLGANLSFLAGRRWGQPLLKRFGSASVHHLGERLAKRGVLTVALIRLVPIAPFPVINVAAGSSPLKLRVFNLGSLLGMAPGMLGVALLADRTLAAVENPSPWAISLLVLVALVLASGAWYVQHALRDRASS